MYFLIDLVVWTAALTARELPPQEKDFARRCGRSRRTVQRWLQRAGFDNWDDFLSVHAQAGHSYPTSNGRV